MNIEKTQGKIQKIHRGGMMSMLRPIGKTGISASIIGLGCKHLDGKPLSLVKVF
jgi:hypothetical protein